MKWSYIDFELVYLPEKSKMLFHIYEEKYEN